MDQQEKKNILFIYFPCCVDSWRVRGARGSVKVDVGAGGNQSLADD